MYFILNILIVIIIIIIIIIAIGGLDGRHKKITINGHFRKWSISSECVTILFSP